MILEMVGYRFKIINLDCVRLFILDSNLA